VSTFCCQDYATEIFELLIQSGIDVNSKTDEGWNALLLLCRNYQKDDLITEIVELLIGLGIDVNCKTLDGWNALVALCRYYKRANLIDVAKMLRTFVRCCSTVDHLEHRQGCHDDRNG
jgi:ankyrin repeat protein